MRIKSNLGDLPLGWAHATIDVLVPSCGVFNDGDWVESKDQDPNGDVRLIQLADIGDGIFIDKSNRFLTRKKASELNCTFLNNGDLLIARMPDPLGRACLFPLSGAEKYVTVVDVCIVRLGQHSANRKFLMYVINSPEIRSQIETYKSGSTRKRISRANLKKITFPLPPRKEQDRIVARIETLFADLESGIQCLVAVRKQMEVYRQSFLKRAFEGKLTEGWRVKGGGHRESADELLERLMKARESNLQIRPNALKVPVRQERARKAPKKPQELKMLTEPFRSRLPELPLGWNWTPLAWLLAIDRKPMTTGPFGTMLKKSDHRPTGVPVLGIENIGKAVFVEGNKIFISETKANDLPAFEVEAGDIIISRSGTVGEICEVPFGLGRALISTNLLRVALNPEVIRSRFFVFLFQACVSVKGQVNELCKGSSRDFLNQAILSALAFPLPSLPEQDELLSQIDSEVSRLEKLNEEIEANLLRGAALRQSILKAAIAGKLILRNRKDEPASMLLERIKNEKIAKVSSEKTKPKNGRRKAA